MLPIKIKLPDDYLTDEVRNGYHIKGATKELWAVELDLLNELMEFCSRNNINVYAGYGTLLGAVRHNGFIPWDDDIDVMMKYEDYTRFCQIASFSPPYFLQTEDSDIGFSRNFARLRNSNTTCIQKSEDSLRISYNQGVFIDIFPMYYVPEEYELRREVGIEARKLRDKALKWSTFTYRPPIYNGEIGKDLVKIVASMAFNTFLKPLYSKNPYLKELNNMYLKQKYSTKLADLWFYDPETDKHCFETEDWDQIEFHTFEFTRIPIPSGYDRILRASFGEWTTPKKDDNDHGGLIIDCHTPYTEYQKRTRQ